MEIKINQAAISISDKYTILIDGQERYRASKEIFTLLAKLNLFEIGDSIPRLSLSKNWTWFSVSFDLKNGTGEVYEFRTKSSWKSHYYCNVGNEYYEIFGHSGTRYSVFKNNVQVAWWDKNAIKWFDADKYAIITDSDADHELIISFCLIIDTTFSKDDNNTVTIDFGNIGSQAREFDPTWQPDRG